MRRGNLFVAVLSALGGVLAFAIAGALHAPVSLYTALGVVLLANAVVRYQLARR